VVRRKDWGSSEVMTLKRSNKKTYKVMVPPCRHKKRGGEGKGGRVYPVGLFFWKGREWTCQKEGSTEGLGVDGRDFLILIKGNKREGGNSNQP